MIEKIIEELGRLLYEIPAILLAISAHEYCHSWVAFKLGDDTAADMGLLNINPFPRIDVIGFLMFIWFRYGWTRTTPVDFRKIGPPRSRAVLVILAGILGNFLLSVFFILILKLKKPVPESYFYNFIKYSIMLNFNLVFINFLPVLPMDGGMVIRLFWPGYARFVFPGAVLIILFSLTRFSGIIHQLSNTILNLFI